jgi:small-conductance mechanosensitive channel
MSDILFELEYTRRIEDLKAAYRRVFFLMTSSVILHTMLVVMLLGYAYLGIKTHDKLYLILAGVMLLALLLRVWIYWLSIRTLEKREKELFNGKEPTVHAEIFDDFIRLKTVSETETPVSSLKQAFRMKSLIVIRTKANLLFVFPVSGFKLGTPEGLLRFLAERGVRIS